MESKKKSLHNSVPILVEYKAVKKVDCDNEARELGPRTGHEDELQAVILGRGRPSGTLW
jgi:hypothetical protein